MLFRPHLTSIVMPFCPKGIMNLSVQLYGES